MSFETMSACADLILADAIEDLARESGREKSEIRKEIMTSKAYDCLYNFDLGLWQQGPAYFIDFYKKLKD
jgi:hypothetical protein